MKSEGINPVDPGRDEEQVDIVGDGDDIVIVTIITLLVIIWQMSFYESFCSC